MRSREEDLSLGRRTVNTFSSSQARTNDQSWLWFAHFPACAAVPAQRHVRAADVADIVSICRVRNWCCKGDCTLRVSTPQLRPNVPVMKFLLEIASNSHHPMWLMGSHLLKHRNLRTKPNGAPILLPSYHSFRDDWLGSVQRQFRRPQCRLLARCAEPSCFPHPNRFPNETESFFSRPARLVLLLPAVCAIDCVHISDTAAVRILLLTGPRFFRYWRESGTYVPKCPQMSLKVAVFFSFGRGCLVGFES